LLQLLALLLLVMLLLLLLNLPPFVSLCKYVKPPELNHVSPSPLLSLLLSVLSTLPLPQSPMSTTPRDEFCIIELILRRREFLAVKPSTRLAEQCFSAHCYYPRETIAR
jgi:hypothetical protein